MAHADYACCACCDSKVYYKEGATPKQILCETCLKNISDITGKIIVAPRDFQNIIENYKSQDELLLFLQKVGFHFCFYSNLLDQIVSNKVGYKYTQFIKNNYNLPESMKIILIQANGKYYISDNLTGDQIHTKPGRITHLGNMYVDGELPKLGLAGGWYCVDEIPKKIQKLIPKTNTNYVWMLKDNLKEAVTKEYPNIQDKFYGQHFPEEYEKMGFAYSLYYDVVDEHFEDVAFELITLESEKSYIPRYLNFSPYFNTQDVITTPKVLLPSKPCAVSGKELYSIIRKHIKANINPKAAKITSDYDFCFTVEKIIDVDQYAVKFNVSRNSRPKYETRLLTTKNVVIYKNSPEGYNGYPKQEDWHANSCEEMDQKIKTFLEDLMNKINTPMVQCPTCKGCGVVEKV